MTTANSRYETFCEQGYMTVEAVLSPEEVLRAKAALARPFQLLCAKRGLPVPEDGDDESLHRAMVALKNLSVKDYLNTIKISQNHHNILSIPGAEGVQRALKDAGLAEPVVALKPFPVLVSDELHIEGGYNLRPLHQEWPVMQGSTDALVCWIALHDITHQHNALHLIPGTHKKGMLPYERTKCGTGIVPEYLPDVAPQRMEIKAGDAVLFSCFLAHGSSPTGGGFRQAVTIRFNNLAAPDLVERGFPDPSRIEIERQPENMHKPTGILRSF
ncbi:phytanoyl-CoA dioxygenase family protein [Kordiimonas sp.]|uniref:phytanoyl-CoA dioxygenase family protein n=1 Tax=Kordiimonas sp. TaxID=1970157 RepID=UPI003A90A3D0